MHYPKSQQSTIQYLLYPKQQKNMNFSQHKRNIDFLKYIDQKNKEIQQQNEELEEKKNNEPLYKIKRFELISSRLAEQTEEWVKKEAEKRRRSPIINHRLNPPNKNCISPYYDPYSMNKQKGSLFERYYRIKKDDINSNRNSNSIYYNNNNNYNYHPLTSSERNYNNNNNIHESKSSLPKNNGIILPKIDKNFLKENIDIVRENKVPKRYKSKQENRNSYHKDYGKTPEYLKQYKLEDERRKEYENLLKEQATYPKGTRLLPESERIQTLNDLIASKKEIENMIEKMPITNRSMAINEKKEQLLNKIDDLNKAIEMFSKKKVFVKIDE